MESHVGTASVEIVATEQGGFPVDNIGYWKEVTMLTANGERGPGLMISFKAGGFIEIPGMTAEQFTSLVYGVPF